MKQLSLVFAVSILSSCTKQQPRPAQTTQITVIEDLTDTFALKPLAEPILSLYDFQHDVNQAGVFRLVLITDKLLNPSARATIGDGGTSEQENATDDMYYREQLVRSFYDQVRNTIKDFHTQYAPAGGTLKHSECYATIACNLEELASRTVSQRFLLVFSDLQENSTVFSCYTPAGQALLQADPDEVAQRLQTLHPMPDNLTGVTVCFVYDPKTRVDDFLFSEMVNLYKGLLHKRGARVVVQATNTSYKP